MPYNYYFDKSNPDLNRTQTPYQIYEEYRNEGTFPKGGSYSKFAFGNAMETVNYVANGEASDWMLNELNIIAMSIEIGIDDNSYSFYPE